MYGPHTHAEKKCSLRYILAMPEPIYLDHAATTPVRPEVREAMEPFFGPRFGNPSSMHRWGREARVALDEARERVAACLGARTDEVCFTSGGTESDNLAVLGAWRSRRVAGRNAVVSTPIEHKAVLGAVHQAGREGAEERLCAMTSDCVVDIDSFGQLVGEDVAIASVMWVNNEVGTIQPIGELAATANERGVLFHTDAVQAFGKLTIDAAGHGDQHSLPHRQAPTGSGLEAGGWPRALRTRAGKTCATRSIATSVVRLPRLMRMAALAISGLTPHAVSTCDGVTLPLWHADPAEHAIP